MAADIEARLRGTRRGHIFQEFLTNSAHFPLANLFLELLRAKLPGFLAEPDAYVLIGAAVVQALVAGRWRYAGTPRPLLANLVGPACYTAIEVGIEGLAFFDSPYHQAYWGYALAIGLVQEARSRSRGRWAALSVIVENVVRTSILLGMYWIFEALDDPKNISLAGFLADPSHAFVAIVIPLLGLIVGFANQTAERYLAILQETAAQLRQYSEWLLGRDLLSRAVEDRASLHLRRQERTLLFMDIRGFTGWSESRPPEEVVGMLNAYFEAAEAVWPGTGVIKIKFTADEIMAVFPSAEQAVRAAWALRERTRALLAPIALGAGIGLNTGPVVEGLLGTRNLMGYEAIGDAVNTAKRICDQAAAGEVLLAEATRVALCATAEAGPSAPAPRLGLVRLGPARQISAKGKAEPLTVHPLEGLADARAAG
jgi:class 3 adenylate cyclase